MPLRKGLDLKIVFGNFILNIWFTVNPIFSKGIIFVSSQIMTSVKHNLKIRINFISPETASHVFWSTTKAPWCTTTSLITGNRSESCVPLFANNHQVEPGIKRLLYFAFAVLSAAVHRRSRTIMLDQDLFQSAPSSRCKLLPWGRLPLDQQSHG